MPILFRRHSNVACFFCQNSISPLPRDLRNFCCPSCGCWNRFDQDGNILSDDPAMHDASLNLRSFSKRASPSKDRLPTLYGKGPFCHTCQTNQMLLVNLLSNYLPPPNDPEYARRFEMLPAYKENLHRRYPPVCDACLPAVEDEIKKKDHMARTQALGKWLQDSKGRERQRRASDAHKGKERLDLEIIAWRLRGILWAVTLSLAVLFNSLGAMGYRPWGKLISFQPLLPIIVLLSLLWTAWDPTYASFRRAQKQGRTIRIRGKSEYIKLQMTAWLSRGVTSSLLALAWYQPNFDYLFFSAAVSWSSRVYFSLSLALELITVVISCTVLRLQHPPAIRLLNTNSHKASSGSVTPTHSKSRSHTPAIQPLPVAEPDLLSALSLSTNPIIAPTNNPIFGLPSLLSTLLPPTIDKEVDVDAMDWMPTDPLSEQPKQETGKQPDVGSWLRPQRFFAPEKPTGLETLFERALLVNDTPSTPDERQRRLYITNHARHWWWVYVISFAPVAAVAYKVWEGMNAWRVISTWMSAISRHLRS